MHVKLYMSGSFCLNRLSAIASILHKDNISKGKDLYKGRLEISGVAGARDIRVAQYCLQEYSCYANFHYFQYLGLFVLP